MPDLSSLVSLGEANRSIPVAQSGRWWRRFLPFIGPGFMVSVGYMDPGNWATDLSGGSRYGYALLWVILASNLIAMLLQTLCARLGIVARRDLAQACREYYTKPTSLVLWFLCELAIIACDLAEVIGSAIALQLLFGLPLTWGVLVTSLDVLALMGLAALGFRKLEALIMVLVLTIAACFAFQIFVSQPDWGGVVAGLTRPSMPDGEALFISLGILGATVMPHNLYLHSAVVQTRNVENSPAGIKSAVKMSTIEVIAALGIAFFVNAAILIVAAALFHKKGVVVEELSQAYTLLKPMFQGAAATAFAVALLASGQSSTITGTLAGQIVMEGFLNLRIKPWARRMITRLLAIVPAYILVQASHGKNTVFLLTLSQVVLSMQLSFAVFPLIGFTSSRKIMGEFANPVWLKTLAYTAGIAIGVLNAYLLWKVIQDQSQPIAIGCYVALGALTLFLIVNSKKRD